MGAVNHVFSAFSLLSCILVLIPLPWHLEAWNTGTCLYIIWTALGCLTYFINSIIWDGNVVNRAPVWCDIVTKFHIGLRVAIPASLLCITRRLHQISRIKTMTATPHSRRRNIIIDLAIAVGIPLIAMALHYIVQGHRFDIIEDIGCIPDTYNTPPAYPLVLGPPAILCLISGVYSALTFKNIYKLRLEFSASLGSTKTLTATRYYRLMALSATDLLISTPYNIFVIVSHGTFEKIAPWISWEDTHFGFSRVDQVPARLWRSSLVTGLSIETSRWATVGCALIFFAFFGFGSEARRHYKQVISWTSTKLRCENSTIGALDSVRSWKIGTSTRHSENDAAVSPGTRFSEALRAWRTPTPRVGAFFNKASSTATLVHDVEKGVYVEKQVLHDRDSVHPSIKIMRSSSSSTSSTANPSTALVESSNGRHHPPGLDSLIASPQTTPSASPRPATSALPSPPGARFHEMLRGLRALPGAQDAEVLAAVNEDTISKANASKASISLPPSARTHPADDESFLPSMTVTSNTGLRDSVYSLDYSPSVLAPPVSASRSRTLTPPGNSSPTCPSPSLPLSERRNRSSFPVSVSGSTTILDLTSPPMHDMLTRVPTHHGRV